MELMLSTFESILKPLMIFLAITILIKPLVVMFICSFFGYKKRTSFLASVSLAQISEFSLIIVAQGLLLGHVSQEIFSLTILLAIITLIFTTYFVKFENRIYDNISKYLDVFDKFSENKEGLEYMPQNKSAEIILCGYNRIGYGIVKTLRRMKKRVLIVDFNPETIKNLIKEKVPALYGDVGDIEILERLKFKKARMVISTIPTEMDNKLLIKIAKKENPSIVVFVTASQINEALELYDAGADYVVLPHFLGGEHLSLLMEDFTGNMGKIIEHKIDHIKELKERRSLGHEHPIHYY